MRTSSIISYTAILASSTSLALSFASPESFDNSLLRGRSFLPAVVPANVNAQAGLGLVKRAEGPWDCSEDEEYVPYGDDEGDDEEDDNDDDDEVFQPNKGEVKAVAPAAPAQQQQQQQQQQQPQKQEAAPAPAPAKEAGKATTSPAKHNDDNSGKKADSSPEPAPMPKDDSKSSLTTPDNIAEGTYTAEEGCARFYTVQAGDICLGLVEKNADLGLTLDQLYCLNPAIDDLCYNLWIGTAYCVGYNGEEPLNTGVSSSSSKRA